MTRLLPQEPGEGAPLTHEGGTPPLLPPGGDDRDVRRWPNLDPRGRLTAQRLILAITLFVVAFLVIGPLVITAVATFKPRGTLPTGPGGFTLDNYRAVLTSSATLHLLWNTLIFSIGSLTVGTSLAVAFSWLVERTNIPARNVVFTMVVAPMAMPGMLAGIAWIFLLDPRMGVLNTLIRALTPFGTDVGPLNIYTLSGMVFIEGFRMVPSLFLMTSAAFRSMDPSLEEASRVSGKSTFKTVRAITLPLMWPAILSAMLYYFIVVVEAFEIPGVLGLSAGRHVFSTRIYRAVHPISGGLPDYGLASTLGLVLIIMAVVAVWLYNRQTRNARQFITVTGKGYRPRRLPLGKWKYPAIALCATYFLVALAMPLMILLWSSLQPFYRPPSMEALSTLTLGAYRNLATYPGMVLALKNTVILTLVAATGTMILALFVGRFTARLRTKTVRLLDLLAFLPHAVASIVLALGVLLLYVAFPNPVYGTIYIIAIASVTRYLAYGSRVMNSAILQCDPSLEEVSLMSGAGQMRTYRRILLPLVLPAFVNGWIWVAVHAARELSAALMLYTPRSVVISTKIWVLWETGGTSIASALGFLLIVGLMIVTWAGRSFFTRRSPL